MSLRVGITGGIGSGKTYVCQLIRHLGYPVFHADEEARAITESNNLVVEAIKKHFGKNIYIHGKLNRQEVARIVFSDPQQLAKLNAIVHPAVAEYFESWCSKHSNSPLVFKEAAILFETGLYKELDKNILVTAPLDIRIQRVMERDKVTPDEVVARIANQMNDEEKVRLADFTILNDNQNLVLPQVLKILRQLTELV